MTAAGVIKIQHKKLRRIFFISRMMAEQMVVGDDAEIWKFEIINIHGKPLLDLLFDVIINYRIGFPGSGRSEDYCCTEWIDDIDSSVVHFSLITEPRRQIHRIFIGNQAFFLHKRFVFIIEHVIHHIIFNDP